MEEGLRGVWRIDLGCFVVLGDYEKSPLKDTRGVWRRVSLWGFFEALGFF